jgi:single-stranded-DNA-specific exonuclease
LVSFGGHQAAAGVQLHEHDLDRFRELFCAAAQQHLSSRDTTPHLAGPGAEVLLDQRDDPWKVVQDLALLEPCGLGNPVPRIGIAAATVGRAQAVRGGHLQLQVTLAHGQTIYGFAQGLGHLSARLAPGMPLDLIGVLRRDTFRGGTSVAMRIDAVAPSSARFGSMA